MYGIRRMKGGCFRLLVDIGTAATLSAATKNDPSKLYGKTAEQLTQPPYYLSEHDAANAVIAIRKYRAGEML